MRFLEQRRGAVGGDCLRFAVWRRNLLLRFGWLEGGERERSFHREEAGENSVFRPAFSASSSTAQQQRFQQYPAAVTNLRFSAAADTAVQVCVFLQQQPAAAFPAFCSSLQQRFQPAAAILAPQQRVQQYPVAVADLCFSAAAENSSSDLRFWQ